MEKYIVDGKGYDVSPEKLETFLQEFPNAVKYQEPGKTTDSSTETQTMESNGMDSGSDDGSSVFAGTGWGKPTKFINTGIKQDEGRNTFKAEQTSTFENIPGATTIPKIKGFRSHSSKQHASNICNGFFWIWWFS